MARTRAGKSVLKEVIILYDSVADMVAEEQEVGEFVGTKGYYTPGDGGDAIYFITTGSPDGYINHSVNGGANIAEVLKQDGYYVKQIGNNASGIQAVFDTEDAARIQDDPDDNEINIGNTTLVFDSPSGSWNDHSKSILDGLHIRGDKTATVVEFGSSYSSVRDCVFSWGDVALERQYYVCDGYKNHYYESKIGLKLIGVTAYTEREIYARGNGVYGDASLGALYITGALTENITISGGAMEGNFSPAIKVDVASLSTPDRFLLTLENVYFEQNGSVPNSIPAIDAQVISTTGRIIVKGCKLSYNTLGYPGPSGLYKFGSRVSFIDGSVISGYIHADSAEFRNSAVTGTYLRANDGVSPMLVTEFKGMSFDGGFNQVGGFVIAAPVKGGIISNQPYDNIAPVTHPFLVAADNNPPVIAEDATLDYGEGSWTKATFSAGGASYNNNDVSIGSFYDVTNNTTYCEFLIKSNITTTYEVLETGVGGRIGQELQLEAGKVYRLIAWGTRVLSGNNYFKIIPKTTSASEISVLALGLVTLDNQAELSALIASRI